jgi:hypothetical protein
MNTLTKSIPTNIVAGIGGFKEVEFFELEDPAQRQAPQVKLS